MTAVVPVACRNCAEVTTELKQSHYLIGFDWLEMPAKGTPPSSHPTVQAHAGSDGILAQQPALVSDQVCSTRERTFCWCTGCENVRRNGQCNSMGGELARTVFDSRQLRQRKQKKSRRTHDVEQKCKQAGIINAESQRCSGVDTPDS